MNQFIRNPSIPYNGPIGCDGKFPPQTLITIQGIVPEVSFNIHLQCGPVPFSPDVALQISVQISNRRICLNSSIKQELNTEIHTSADPIGMPGERFKIVVLCQFDHYKIIINDFNFYKFPHRIHYDKISHLGIDGDVCITLISFDKEYEHELNLPSYSNLFSSPINKNQQVEPLLSPNNCDNNSSPPPSYETVTNSNEDAKPYPVQPHHAHYVAMYRAQQIQFQRNPITDVRENVPISNCNKIARGIVSGLLFIIIIVFYSVLKSSTRLTYRSYSG